MTFAIVTGGPSVWRDLQGDVILDDGEFVVVRLTSRDDAGTGTYDVRMPRACVMEIVEDVSA